MALGLMLGQQLGLVTSGIFGYNAVLTGIALGEKKTKNVIWAVAGIALSALITIVFIKSGFPALTAPFVFSTWIIIVAKKSGKLFKN